MVGTKMKSYSSLFLFSALVATTVAASTKDGRFSVFNVVKFPNDNCKGSGSRNGTCYTSEECESRNGQNAGTCAEGYGVCCVISLTCGQTSSENCTYLTQTSTSTSVSTSCDFYIRPLSANICRIRLDLTTFKIAGPVTAAANTATNSAIGGAVGDCTQDSFVVSSAGGGVKSPVICGTNSGQHLYVDSNGADVVTASFAFNDDSNTREFDIKVLQYPCNHDMGGPKGCLQYFTGETGTFKNFNFQSTAADANPHLSDQHYDICFRREADQCGICYAPTATTGSFSVGVSTALAVAKSGVGTDCTADFLTIPNGVANTNFLATPVAVAAGADRFCGQALDETREIAVADANSVCSSTIPFKVTFHTDANEIAGTAAQNVVAMATLSEFSAGAAAAPNTALGTHGFQLTFKQQKCP